MFIYLDTETTGIEERDRLCQLAYKTDSGIIFNELFKPPVPISMGAMATHHITEQMVADKSPFIGSQAYTNLIELLQNPANYPGRPDGAFLDSNNRDLYPGDSRGKTKDGFASMEIVEKRKKIPFQVRHILTLYRQRYIIKYNLKKEIT